VFRFVERLGQVCRKICIVDTRIALHPKTRYTYNDRIYFGTKGEEHEPSDSKENKMAKLWASLDNNENFWLSRPTLYNALSHAGFTTVYECNVPAEPKKPVDRITVVAIKGQTSQLLNAPLMVAQPSGDMPERAHREDSVAIESMRRISFLLPHKVRKFGKALMGRDNKLT
jgi:hypothetical protein